MKFKPVLFALPLLVCTSNAFASPVPNSVKTRILNSWRNSFRAIDSLQLAWQSDDARAPANYSFLWHRGVFRADTRFSSKNPKPQDYARYWQSNESGSFAELEQTNKGFYRAIIRPSPLMKTNPYGVQLPLLQLFHFARGVEEPYTIEAFQQDATWTNLARRVGEVSRGSYRGQRGVWLHVAHRSEPKTSCRVFVGEKHTWPLCVELSRFSAGGHFFSRIENVRMMPWGKRLFPTQTRWRGWSKEIVEGEEKRYAFGGTETSTAIINARIEPKRFALPIPKDTLTSVLDDKLTPVANFEFDPNVSVALQIIRANRELKERRRKIAAMPKIWNEKTDGRAQIKAALALAQTQNKRVLLQFGTDLCGPCRKLHDALHQNAEVARMLKSGFVSSDIEYIRNEKLNHEFKAPKQEFAPSLVVLDASGKVLAQVTDDALQTVSPNGSSAFNTPKIKAFLRKWAP